MSNNIPKVKVSIADDKYSSTELAKGFLKSKKGLIHYFNHNFYQWTGKHYSQFTQVNDLYLEIITYLTLAKLWFYVTARKIKDIATALKGLTLLKSEKKIPFWINGSSNDDFIPVKNGLFNLSKFLQGDRGVLYEHDPNYFCNFSLDFDYDPSAECPTFLQILSDIQPNPDVQRFLQQWFGLNLIHDTSHEKFVIFLGNGRNGKSLLLKILKLLLGEENYSTVPLENLNGRFERQQTVGKLANIVGEISDSSRFPETFIKSFLSAEDIMTEKKFQDAVKETPTARITAAANNHPYFRDTSDGIWRREILIPFDVQIPDDQVNPEYTKKEFWYANKEISGIFNWALEGLKDLKQSGSLAIPQNSKDALEEVRSSLNPVAFYLKNHLIAEGDKEISSAEIYHEYSWHCEHLGVKKVSTSILGREIKKVFPDAKQQNAKLDPKFKTRSRYWSGLRLKRPEET